MDPNSKKKYRKRNFEIYIFSVSMIILIIGTMCCIAFSVIAVLYNNTKFLSVTILFFVLIFITFGNCLLLLKNKGYGKSPVEPYSFEFSYKSSLQFIEILSEHFTFTELSNNVYSAYTIWKNHHYHFIVYSLNDYNVNQFKNLERYSIKTGISLGVFRNKFSREQFRKTVRINFIFLNSLSDSAVNATKSNSAISIQEAEGIVNCYIDCGNSTIYIPALWGGYTIHSKKYGAAIKMITELQAVASKSSK